MMSLGKKVKQIGVSPEYIFKKEKIIEQTDYVRDSLPLIENYFTKTDAFSKDEFLFGKIIEKLKKVYKPVEKFIIDDEEYVQEEEEKKQFQEIFGFYDKLGKVFMDITNKRKELKEQIFPPIQKNILDQQKEIDSIPKMELEYQKVLHEYNIWNRRVKKLGDKLLKAEDQTKSVTDYKKKKKKKVFEEKKLEQFSAKDKDFDDVKKLTMWVEQRTLDEVDFHTERRNNDLLHDMYQMAVSYKNFHYEIFKRFADIEREFNLQMKLKSYRTTTRPNKVLVKKIRPGFQVKQTVIGIDVEKVMQRQTEKGGIPRIAELMIKYIKGITTLQGIFRMAGNKEEIQYLLRHIDQGKISDLSEVDNPHNVCAAMKEYIRTLPQSFCPLEAFEEFFSFTEDMEIEEKTYKVRKMIDKGLSPANRQLFWRIFELFKYVRLESAKNKMTTENLSIVWSINIFRSAELSNPLAIIGLQKKFSAIFTFVLDNFDDIFPKPLEKPRYEKEAMDIPDSMIKPLLKKILKRSNLMSPMKSLGRKKVGDALPMSLGPLSLGPMTMEGRKKRLKEIDISGITKQTIDTGEEVVTSLLAMGHFLVCGDKKGRFKVYELGPRGFKSEPKSIIRAHNEEILLLKALSNDYFISSSPDLHIKIWSFDEGEIKIVKDIKEFDNPVEIIVVTEKEFVIACHDRLSLFSASTFEKIIAWKKEHSSKIVHVFERGGKFYSISKRDRAIFEWNRDSVNRSRAIEMEKSSVSYANPSSTSGIVAGFSNGDYCTWSEETKKIRMVHTGQVKVKNIFELDGPSDVFVVVFTTPKSDLITHCIREVGMFSQIKLLNKIVDVKKIDDKRYFFYDESNVICIVEDLTISKKFLGHLDDINCVIAFYDSKFIVSAGADNFLKLWKL